MNNTEDLYEILQVHHAAEPEVIEAAYRRLLRMYHPDVNNTKEAHDITVRLNYAYEILRDPTKRADYDRQRSSQAEYNHRQQERHNERPSNERLFEAVNRSDAELVRTLISAGVDVNARDNNDWTAIHLAARQPRLETVLNLISAGADVNARSAGGWTPVHEAARWGRTSTISALISAGADVNAQNTWGWTPAHSAARWGQTISISTLISAGADVDARNRNMERPYDLAMKAGHNQTATAIRRKGG